MSAPTEPPLYKGEPLDSERGPGLGCFWIQVGLLVFFLVFTPLTVTWGWPPIVSGALLIFTLILLLFTGQTIIFLLRLVAADRRTRRAPLDPNARRVRRSAATSRSRKMIVCPVNSLSLIHI